MTDVEKLVKRAETFAKRSKLSMATVSTYMFNDGKRLDELRSGKSRIWPETLEKAAAALADLEAERA